MDTKQDIKIGSKVGLRSDMLPSHMSKHQRSMWKVTGISGDQLCVTGYGFECSGWVPRQAIGYTSSPWVSFR